jgi:hypothetical protein
MGVARCVPHPEKVSTATARAEESAIILAMLLLEHAHLHGIFHS